MRKQNLERSGTTIVLYCVRMCVLLAFFYGCSGTSSKPQSEPPVETNKPSATPDSNNPLKEGDPFISFLFKENLGWMAEAWQRFTADGRYRIANPSETQSPYERGDINHDNTYNDFVIIVVDNKRTDAARFGLVIFNAPKDGKTTPDPYLFYRERELSRIIIRKWSGGLILSELRKDGTEANCYLNWDERRQRYSCDKEYDGSHLGLPRSKFKKL